MKKYIWGLFVVIILSIGGYFIYNNFIKESEYSVLFNELNKKDKEFLEKYGKIKVIIKEGKDINLYLKGNEEKRKKILDEIKRNKHVNEVYEISEMEGNRIH